MSAVKKYNFEAPTLVPFGEIIEATISDYKAVDSALAVNSIHSYSTYYCAVAATPTMGNCPPAMPPTCGLPTTSYTQIVCSGNGGVCSPAPFPAPVGC